MDDAPNDSKLTRTKRLWAETGKFLTGRQSRPVEERLPPGQHLVRDWPVLDLGVHPNLPLSTWRLDVVGLVESPLSLNWEQFQELPQTELRTDIHCVTTWSRYDNDWRGVRVRDLLDIARPVEATKFALLHSYDGYTTNLPLEDFAAPDAMLVTHWQDQPLTQAHGGPMRAMVPHLYFWKSAKWLSRIELIGADRAGFWERNGYHMYGDPWREQRYSED
jgi:DMSO/TMAO reductase YedYZ molybdopterin-dependent catalytic subunit